MTSLSVDREREHARPREVVWNAVFDACETGHFDTLAMVSGKFYFDGEVSRVEVADAVLKALISHGWITIDGLEAMKKERGME